MMTASKEKSINKNMDMKGKNDTNYMARLDYYNS